MTRQDDGPAPTEAELRESAALVASLPLAKQRIFRRYLLRVLNGMNSDAAERRFWQELAAARLR